VCLQNTYTNADKLLEAAEQLAQTGECDPEEIYQAAHQLEDRIQDFVRRVEQRKVLLDMSVAFHTHVKEVSPNQPGAHNHVPRRGKMHHL
jgi:triple functional domain protein